MNVEEYFSEYTSNTLAGTGNQTFFNAPTEKRTLAMYKPFAYGKFSYSFLYTNTVDSTYEDGTVSKRNDLCGVWTIKSLSVFVADGIEQATTKTNMIEKTRLTFDGEDIKTVTPGERFCTDPVFLKVKNGQYICIETVFYGEKIPCHVENKIPTFSFESGIYRPDKYMPLPSMVGCDRKVKARIGFWGDSITQGIGCEEDSYAHYCSVAANIVGKEYSFWNLGIGYARGNDAATDGAWAYKAKRCDFVVVCFGTNDVIFVKDYDKTVAALEKIIALLKGNNIKVVLQTLPPFDFVGEDCKLWNNLNNYLLEKLAVKADGLFDQRALLCSDKGLNYTAYGDHPNETGCKIWGENLGEYLKKVLKGCDL